jgi:predicted transglutaminase-like cysteine proteinase
MLEILQELLQDALTNALNNHQYITDQAQYNIPEYWTINLVGDCEDFALWCRQELSTKGIPSDLVYCLTEDGEGHLVCSVDGWILDNRYTKLMRRDDLPYTWITIGKPDGTWYIIES